MKRILLPIIAVVAAFAAASAQSPEAIRKFISENTNFAIGTLTDYTNVPIGKLATPPKGYKPFYFSMVGRHGSRYELRDTTFSHTTDIFTRAAKLGILTEEGKRVHEVLLRATAEQMGKGGELTALGQEQWRDIGRRAYKNFPKVFDGGSVEGMSSNRLRCVFSMVAFVDGLKEKNGSIVVEQEARASTLPIIRPIIDNPASPKEFINSRREPRLPRVWMSDFMEWSKSFDLDRTLSKLVTNKELMLKELGANSLFYFLYRTHHLLLFSHNFGFDNKALINSIFSLDDLYHFYCFHAIPWMYQSWGWGYAPAETFASYIEPLVDDIFDKAQAAIDGKNPHTANIRFTHDSYVVPLIEVFGFDGYVAKFDTNISKAVSSAPFNKMIPMAANVQLQLYRNKEGKVLVRAMLNEADMTLPIACDTAPFYPWEEFRKAVEGNMNRLIATRDKFLPEWYRQNKK